MRVDLIVQHQRLTAKGLLARLEAQFGINDPAVLHNSPLGSMLTSENTLYSVESAYFRLIAWQSQTDELQLVVEPLNARLDASVYDRAWTGVRKALHDREPALLQAQQIDNASNQTIQVGHVGMRAEIRQKEIWLPILLGAISLVWTTIGVLSFAADNRLIFASGSLMPIAGGLIAGAFLAINSGRKIIRWTGTA